MSKLFKKNTYYSNPLFNDLCVWCMCVMKSARKDSDVVPKYPS
ncbi:hypothetical protein PV797_04665 [Clostridiaceae bacterium M8S5]|nr:hypothetical protein PV797_04665 [Clostridiaceae bacterium M8S5]